MSKTVKKVASVATLGLSDALLKPPKQEPQAVTSTTAPDAAPTAQDPQAVAAREEQKKKQAAYAGLSANVLTKPGGLTGGANTQLKSLLGG